MGVLRLDGVSGFVGLAWRFLLGGNEYDYDIMNGMEDL